MLWGCIAINILLLWSKVRNPTLPRYGTDPTQVSRYGCAVARAEPDVTFEGSSRYFFSHP